MFTCAICQKEHQPWSLAFQERKGGKDICRECKSMMKQSRAITTANKRSQNAISALENRMLSIEKGQKNINFFIKSHVDEEIQKLDWTEILTPAVERITNEELVDMKKEMKSMQRQLLAMHKRMKDLVEKRIWGDD